MFVRNLLMMAGAAGMLFVASLKLPLLGVLCVSATLVPILLLGRRRGRAAPPPHPGGGRPPRGREATDGAAFSARAAVSSM